LLPLLLISLVTLASAAIAMSLRNLIRSALLLIASWAGIAAFYLWAGAEFLAFAQVLVYVGAISMVVLFAVLLTRQSRAEPVVGPESLGRVIAGLLVGGAVLGVLWGAILGFKGGPPPELPPPLSVRQLGAELMNRHALALLAVGLLLTVALLGALVIASTDRPGTKGDQS
jgi:NADH:ubiquinone oxidoreductase subunit 6 (subunit J)